MSKHKVTLSLDHAGANEWRLIASCKPCGWVIEERQDSERWRAEVARHILEQRVSPR